MSSPRPNHRGAQKFSSAVLLGGLVHLGSFLSARAANTNLFSSSLNSASLPDTGPSLLRVLGALALVLGLFLGGAWLVRNGRWNAFSRGKAARLNVLESRSLGARQALYVVGYGQDRFLIGATPAGINLVSHLASAPEDQTDAHVATGGSMSFSQALGAVLRGQKSPLDGDGGSK